MHSKRGTTYEYSILSRRSALMLLSAASMQAIGARLARADAADDLTSVEAILAEAEAGLDVIAGDYEELCKRQSHTLDTLHDVNIHIAKIQRNVVGIAKRLTKKQGELCLNVSDEYKVGHRGVVDVLLGSTSIEDFIENLYYYNKVSEGEVELIQNVKEERARLEDERDRLGKKRDELEKVSRAQAEQLEAMRNKQYEAELLVDELDEEVLGLFDEREEGLLAAQQEAAKARKERARSKCGKTSSASWRDVAIAGMASSSVMPVQRAKRGLVATPCVSQAAAMLYEFEDDYDYGYEDEYEPYSDSDWSEDGGSEYDSGMELESPTELEGEQDVIPDAIPEEVPQEEVPSSVGSAAAVIAACQSTPSPGGGLCAAWCSNVLMNAGFDFVSGNANDMYAEYCYSTDLSELRPGMAVAVSTHPHTTAGRIYGHIGMYIGDGTVMDNIGYIRTISLEEWMSYYGETVPVRWGWLGGYVLE